LATAVVELGGVYILGTERHESRRIDNQLRGRAGRQGDPGESRLFVSLEDQLWKIFNAKMLENPLLRAWPPMEQVDAKFLSGMIRKTQERIENHFFEARKHVLEYDDVLNAQREKIYDMRREVLLGKHVREDLQSFIQGMIEEVVRSNVVFDEQTASQKYDYEGLFAALGDIFPVFDFTTLEELKQHAPGEELEEYCVELAHQAYKRKQEEFGDEVMLQVEQHVMLRAVNDRWMDHLQMVDYIREGIGLRGYGQVDPLIAYKRETFDLFQNTMRLIRDQAVRMIYHAQVNVEQRQAPQMQRVEDGEAAPAGGVSAATASGGRGSVRAQPGNKKGIRVANVDKTLAPSPNGDIANVDWRKVGRNDPCPCGSGKKFKACHYSELRAKGVI
jgi:preprotein translocase subunit SecA